MRIPTTRTHLVRERLVSPWETVGPRFDSQKPRVSGAGARWPAGVLPLVSFDVGGAWRLFACRHGRLQTLPFRNFIGCYPRIEWSLLPLVFNTPPDWVASVTISLSLSIPRHLVFLEPTRADPRGCCLWSALTLAVLGACSRAGMGGYKPCNFATSSVVTLGLSGHCFPLSSIPRPIGWPL